MQTSCIKKGAPEVDNESQCVVDNAIADQELMAVVPAVFKHMSATRGAGAPAGMSGNCSGASFIQGDTTDFDPAAEFAIDASQLSCSLGDGKLRSGKIVVALYGKFGTENSKAIIKLVDYSAGDYAYAAEGYSLTCVGSNTSYYSFNAELPSSRCSIGDKTFAFGCSRTISYYYSAGYETFYGTSTGNSRTGEAYTAEITKDVRKKNNCAYFDSGELTLSPKNFKSRNVFFGDGECDEQAFFAVNQNTVAFKLK